MAAAGKADAATTAEPSARAASLRAALNGLRDPRRAELALSEQLIVGTAHQRQVFRRVGATERPSAVMMKLQERLRLTAMSVFAHE